MRRITITKKIIEIKRVIIIVIVVVSKMKLKIKKKKQLI